MDNIELKKVADKKFGEGVIAGIVFSACIIVVFQLLVYVVPYTCKMIYSAMFQSESSSVQVHVYVKNPGIDI